MIRFCLWIVVVSFYLWIVVISFYLWIMMISHFYVVFRVRMMVLRFFYVNCRWFSFINMCMFHSRLFVNCSILDMSEGMVWLCSCLCIDCGIFHRSSYMSGVYCGLYCGSMCGCNCFRRMGCG
uniref:Uncharacterized protein n=1 Tax=Cacopsylla melanoneura TaxID=428564 RepID=A0A8D9AIF3_9HEMI